MVDDYSGPNSTVWAKPLPGKKFAVLAINGADADQNMVIDFNDLLSGYTHNNGNKTWNVRDVWDKQDLPGPISKKTVSLDPHDSFLAIVSPAA